MNRFISPTRTVRILCIAFIISLLSILAFESIHSGHHCTEEECPVCIVISIIKNQLKSFLLNGIGEAVSAYLFSIYFLPAFFAAVFPCRSLVKQKVRLNN
ncbi:MAG: hypothetical protein IJL70_03995 [Treponema sp.]|nr:hypothetical protein [Treponema sp.]